MASAMRLRVPWLSLSIGIFLQTYSSAAVMLAMVFWSNSVSTVMLYKNGFGECLGFGCVIRDLIIMAAKMPMNTLSLLQDWKYAISRECLSTGSCVDV